MSCSSNICRNLLGGSHATRTVSPPSASAPETDCRTARKKWVSKRAGAEGGVTQWWTNFSAPRSGLTPSSRQTARNSPPCACTRARSARACSLGTSAAGSDSRIPVSSNSSRTAPSFRISSLDSSCSPRNSAQPSARSAVSTTPPGKTTAPWKAPFLLERSIIKTSKSSGLAEVSLFFRGRSSTKLAAGRGGFPPSMAQQPQDRRALGWLLAPSG
mmetsp:Transcript_57373/g.167968  ORF Transcript_57373/g.167968 Transcript_57373/m.167968 type:complete len:215 (+) Transcript_57373:421-1065(+)